jgi:hypothetical protein
LTKATSSLPLFRRTPESNPATNLVNGSVADLVLGARVIVDGEVAAEGHNILHHFGQSEMLVDVSDVSLLKGDTLRISHLVANVFGVSRATLNMDIGSSIQRPGWGRRGSSHYLGE